MARQAARVQHCSRWSCSSIPSPDGLPRSAQVSREAGPLRPPPEEAMTEDREL